MQQFSGAHDAETAFAPGHDRLLEFLPVSAHEKRRQLALNHAVEQAGLGTEQQFLDAEVGDDVDFVARKQLAADAQGDLRLAVRRDQAGDAVLHAADADRGGKAAALELLGQLQALLAHRYVELVAIEFAAAHGAAEDHVAVGADAARNVAGGVEDLADVHQRAVAFGIVAVLAALRRRVDLDHRIGQRLIITHQRRFGLDHLRIVDAGAEQGDIGHQSLKIALALQQFARDHALFQVKFGLAFDKLGERFDLFGIARDGDRADHMLLSIEDRIGDAGLDPFQTAGVLFRFPAGLARAADNGARLVQRADTAVEVAAADRDSVGIGDDDVVSDDAGNVFRKFLSNRSKHVSPPGHCVIAAYLPDFDGN